MPPPLPFSVLLTFGFIRKKKSLSLEMFLRVIAVAIRPILPGNDGTCFHSLSLILSLSLSLSSLSLSSSAWPFLRVKLLLSSDPLLSPEGMGIIFGLKTASNKGNKRITWFSRWPGVRNTNTCTTGAPTWFCMGENKDS
jgi:hypothetical protein